jgi:hypothetical protein
MSGDQELTRRAILTAAGATGIGIVGLQAGEAQEHQNAGASPKQGVAAAQKRKTNHPHGGVHAGSHTPSISGAKVPRRAHGRAPTSAAFPGFVYNGGPVVTCAQVYTSFWGSQWLADPAHLERAGRLSQFHQDLLASGFMNVLHQYGVNGGLFFRAMFIDNVADALTDANIQSIIQSAIDANTLPEPTNPTNTITLIIYLQESIGINDPNSGLVLCEANGDTAFGYHSFFTTTGGHPFYYAVIPGLDDTCLTASCPDDTFCSLHLAESQEQRLTQVASHEFAEMTTDPQLNAWFDPVFGENGDICNGQADIITVGNNTWTVQQTYSKTDDINSNGSTFCLSQAPNPIPPLSPGPGSATAIPLIAARRGHPMLPLFPVKFDAKSKEVSFEEKHVQAYLARIFRPFRPKHVVPDMTGTLEKISKMLAKP